jgi:hypothetical protein
MNCPNCGTEIKQQQSKAATALWATKTKQQRSDAMKRVRRLGIERKKGAKEL